jgi:penicillin-binding protein 1A
VIAEMKIALGAVIQEGTAQRAKELKRQVYGKTGTTNDYTDAWFIGFDDSIVVGVWVGRDDHTPIGAKETGSMAALPIWIEFMKKAPQQNPSEQNP